MLELKMILSKKITVWDNSFRITWRYTDLVNLKIKEVFNKDFFTSKITSSKVLFEITVILKVIASGGSFLVAKYYFEKHGFSAEQIAVLKEQLEYFQSLFQQAVWHNNNIIEYDKSMQDDSFFQSLKKSVRKLVLGKSVKRLVLEDGSFEEDGLYQENDREKTSSILFFNLKSKVIENSCVIIISGYIQNIIQNYTLGFSHTYLPWQIFNEQGVWTYTRKVLVIENIKVFKETFDCFYAIVEQNLSRIDSISKQVYWKDNVLKYLNLEKNFYKAIENLNCYSFTQGTICPENQYLPKSFLEAISHTKGQTYMSNFVFNLQQDPTFIELMEKHNKIRANLYNFYRDNSHLNLNEFSKQIFQLNQDLKNSLQNITNFLCEFKTESCKNYKNSSFCSSYDPSSRMLKIQTKTTEILQSKIASYNPTNTDNISFFQREYGMELKRLELKYDGDTERALYELFKNFKEAKCHYENDLQVKYKNPNVKVVDFMGRTYPVIPSKVVNELT